MNIVADNDISKDIDNNKSNDMDKDSYDNNNINIEMKDMNKEKK